MSRADDAPAAETKPTNVITLTEEELDARIADVVNRMQARPDQPEPASTPTTTASDRGLSSALNPAVSANLVLNAGGTTRPEGTEDELGNLETGVNLQEVEVRLGAIVDPYFRADFTLTANLEEIGFEEAFLSTLSIPHLTIRAGQMYATFGRHGPLHTHTFPFITAPLPWRALLGEEPLVDPGVSFDLLLPLPFFAEVNAQVFRGDWRPFAGGVEDDPNTAVDETIPDLRRTRDLVYASHLKTLFELGDAATLELGGSYLGGRNGWGAASHVVGADLTLKWSPLDAERYTKVEWTTEFLWVQRRSDPMAREIGGGYSALRYQFAQRWWVQGRGALLGLPASGTSRTWRAEALGAFVPSEFSAFRLQYAIEDSSTTKMVHELFLQAIVSIGSHPGHGY